MSQLLNIGILIGLLLNAVKGVDLLLTASQKKRAKEFFEDLALYMDDVRVEDLPHRIAESGVQAIFLLVSLLQWVLLAIFSITLNALTWNAITRYFSIDNWYRSSDILTVQLLTLGLVLLAVLFAWRWPLPQLMHWLIGEASVLGMNRRRRMFTIALFSLFGLGACLFLLTGGSLTGPSHTNRESQTVFLWASIPFNVFLVLLFSVIQSADLAIALVRGNRPLGLRLFLSITKGVLWRLVEYDKGPIDYLVLLVTILLGIWKLSL